MAALDKLIERLNCNPVLWSLGLGVLVYFCAFWLVVLGMFERFPMIFEVGFLSAGASVMTYHWAMSRYIIANTVAQLTQIIFGIGLISISMMFIGAVLHDKTYEWINKLFF